MIRNRLSMGRRAWLKGLGASAALTPFLPMTAPRAAQGAPRRLILMYIPNGAVLSQWRPSGTETAFDLTGTSMESLIPYQDRLLVLEGLEKAWGGRGSGHQKGIATLWSGSEILAGDLFGGSSGTVGWGGGISVDQQIADALGDETPYSSLEFAVQTKSNSVRTRMVYRGADQPVTPEENPYSMFDRLFADFDPSQTDIARIRAQQKSVIDVVSSELETLQPRFSTDERRKVDAHLEAVRDIERRLDLTTTCDVPTLGGEIDIDANDNYPEVGQLQMDLLAAAMRCDLTRVASFQWSKSQSPTRHTWLGENLTHHDLSHENGDAARDRQARLDTWYMEQLGYLMDRLDEVPEADGSGTLLDNTLIVAGYELADGAQHSARPQHFLLAGGGCGYFRMGRYLEYDRDQHNRLLVSLCHMMGLDGVNTFGDLDNGSGPLARLV